jgi:pimeloyl-ACP methyl ester carboxylesterase
MTFLGSYVDGIFNPTRFIIGGISLGGHVSWDVLAKDSRISAAVIVVGCPDLTSLLLDRLGGFTSPAEVPAGTIEWPESISKLYLARDRNVTGITGKKILILNGAVDPLVPSRFSWSWVENYGANNAVTFVEQEDTGHALTVEMVQKIVDWLPQFLD